MTADVVAEAHEGLTSLKHVFYDSRKLVAGSGAHASSDYLNAPAGQGLNVVAIVALAD